MSRGCLIALYVDVVVVVKDKILWTFPAAHDIKLLTLFRTTFVFPIGLFRSFEYD